MFQKLDLFPSSGDGKETPTLLGPLGRANLQWLRSAFSKWPKRVGVSLQTPEDGKRSTFCTIVFSGI
jgi:hypothetical protein